MNFTDIFIRKPVLATTVSLLILVLGLRSLVGLSVRQFPKTQNAVVTISTAYYGADADTVAGFITQPLESAIAQAQGIDYLSSTSTLGVSTIIATLREKRHRPNSPVLVTRHSLREGRRRLRILLAEDNAFNEMVAVNLLERRGHSVKVVNNGQAALDTLGKGTFDLVLMDVQMPEMDGLQATAAIREREAAAGGHVPIIAMTARAMKGDREMCLQAGMDAYVSKPLRAANLFEAIDSLGLGITLDNAVVPPPEPATAAGLDHRAILDEAGGDVTLVRRLAALFKKESDRLLLELKRAVERKDREAIQFAAHALKSSVGHWGQGEAFQEARTLEEMARAGKIAGAQRGCASLTERVVRLQKEVSSLTRKGGPWSARS